MRMLISRRLAWGGLGRTLAALVVLAVGLASRSPVLAADAPKPKKKDSPKQFMSKAITLETSVKPAEAKAGETVTYQVTARIDQPWHIYKYGKEQPAQGPRNTELDLFDTAGLKVAGDWKASREPTKAKDEAFPDLKSVEYHEDEVTWSIPLQIPPGTGPGQKTIRCQISFQLCSKGEGASCTIPGRWTLPAATLVVVPAGAAAAAPAGGESRAAPVAAATSPAAASPSTAAPAPADVEPPPAAETASAAAPAAEVASTRTQPVSEVERSLQQGLVPFLLLAVTGGLIALVMPCVWPMVPITVNFFVKQGHANKGKTLGLAITYCLAIIGIFTLVGVLFSALFGAAYLQRLANAAWLNLVVAGLFLAFGLSLLGLFEFRLPNSLLNVSAQGESRGGLVGVVFMALTLTITSFTCTFPVVGGLLVMAAGGSYLYPVLGLATFATVLALPFFLLALAPGLLAKVPKSGDWMNAVKVVGGLVEIGAAFKFINTAECAFVVPEDAWFDAQVVLAIWVALALICGIYLLGLFRTDHDHDAVKVGPGRILSGSLFLFLALFLAPALFGQPPKSLIWDRLVVGILPADAYELNAPRAAAGGAETAGTGCREVRATSTDPKVAVREERKCHGVSWGMSYEAALEQAHAENKPVLIDFTGVNCANCRLMELSVMPKADVVRLLSRFVTVQLYTDLVPIKSITADQREGLAEDNQLRLAKMAKEATNPFYAIVGPDGQVLETLGGYREPSVFINFLERGLSKHQGGEKVARVGG